jgi:hypothetical protein
VDHRLWGPEKRPAKLGLVIALFIVLGVNLGTWGVVSRVANDPKAQDLVIQRYNQDNATEVAERARILDEYNKHKAEIAARPPVPAARADNADEDGDAPSAAAHPFAAEPDLGPAPDAGPTRADMLAASLPAFGDPLWIKLLPAWFWGVMFLASLLLPAAAVIIALEDKFFKALNPLNVVYLIQKMGSAYFALWAFFLLIAGTRHLVLSAGSQLPAAVGFPLEMLVATYLGLVLFAIMGYALYEFHQELHLDVEVDFEDHREAGGAEAIAKAGSAHAALKEVQPQDPMERKVQALLAEGKVKEAIAEVKDHMRYDRLNPALNTLLHELYVKLGDRDAILIHGQQWMTSLAVAHQGNAALAALRNLLTFNAGLVVENGDAILPIATAAAQSADHALAANLLRNFDKRFPQHKDMPGVYFLGAKLLSEQMRQHDKAARILRGVLAHYPDHAVAGEAKVYLKVLERLQGQPVPS